MHTTRKAGIRILVTLLLSSDAVQFAGADTGFFISAGPQVAWHAVAKRVSPASTHDVTLDSNQTGRMFEGIGAVSAGASSRLVVDYPEPERSQILDYLFKPAYGAALQHLKVEIGGEVNSTDGTEPTHQRTRTDENYQRGYEWWLMKEAKARNPNMSLDSLAWGTPGWIGGGNYYSQDMCDYIVKFIKGAQSSHGLNFDFTGTRNESVVNPAWIKQLRATLDTNGLQQVQLVAADEWGGAWSIVTNAATSVLTDTALSNSVARLGVHYSGAYSPIAAQDCSQPLWSSEDGIGGSTWRAAQKLARLYNRNYILGRMTKTEVWSPVTGYYDILAAPDSGLMRANTPWSGHYVVAPAIWATAHTTQFAQPGWTYLEGGASALLPGGGSIVTLVSTNRTDYSLVVETSDAASAQTITFHLTNGLSAGAVHIWQTSRADWFESRGSLVPVHNSFSFKFESGCIYTLTTTAGQQRGSAIPPVAKPFPLPFADGFDGYGPARTPKYFTDQAGTFETFARADARGLCLRQVLPGRGIRWAAEWQPYTLIGDAAWKDYEVSAGVLSETNNGLVFVMGRVGRVPGFSDPVPHGYWLALDGKRGQWELHAAAKLLASGRVKLAPQTWHQLRLTMTGTCLGCFVDGSRVGEIKDATYPAGMAGLGCGWHGAQFDDFCLQPSPRSRLSPASSFNRKPDLMKSQGSTVTGSAKNNGFCASLLISTSPDL